MADQSVTHSNDHNDWLLDCLTPLQISNALLTAFLVNQQHLTYNHTNGHLRRVGGTQGDREEAILRAKYYYYLKNNLPANSRYGILITSPWSNQPVVPHHMRVTCMSIKLWTGRSFDTGHQLLRAKRSFRFSTESLCWNIHRRDNEEIRFELPVRVMVFEIPNHRDGCQSAESLPLLQRRWMFDVAETFGQWNFDSPIRYTTRLYSLKIVDMETIESRLVYSERPTQPPTLYEPFAGDIKVPDPLLKESKKAESKKEESKTGASSGRGKKREREADDDDDDL